MINNAARSRALPAYLTTPAGAVCLAYTREILCPMEAGYAKKVHHSEPFLLGALTGFFPWHFKLYIAFSCELKTHIFK